MLAAGSHFLVAPTHHRLLGTFHLSAKSPVRIDVAATGGVWILAEEPQMSMGGRMTGGMGAGGPLLGYSPESAFKQSRCGNLRPPELHEQIMRTFKISDDRNAIVCLRIISKETKKNL